MIKKLITLLKQREKKFKKWVIKHCQQPIISIMPLAPCAGFRRYFRLQLADNSTIIAVDSPCKSDNPLGFIALSSYFHSLTIPVPTVLACQKRRGFLLVTDCGNTTLETAIANQAELTYPLYQKAIDTLIELQCKTKQTPSVKFKIPSFDEDYMMLRFNLFIKWFLRDLLQLTYDEIGEANLSDLFELMCQLASSQPQVVLHMDYQCRNILVNDDHTLTLLDFQDAMTGPMSYDLVSLLWDCYLDFPENQVKAGMQYYFDQCVKHDLIDPIESETMQLWFYNTAILRHFKNLFVFSRKYLRDEDDHYLTYLPRITRYIERALASFPELSNQYQWWKKVVLPRVAGLSIN